MMSVTIAVSVCTTVVCVVPDHECSGRYHCCSVALLSRNWCQLLYSVGADCGRALDVND
jgi:hypothetical protein